MRASLAHGTDGGGPLPCEALPPETAAVLLSGASDHDREFTAFMAAAVGPLTRTAWLLCGDAHRAEELVQQALVKTYVAWPRAREGDPLVYARRILANARIDTWRRTRREHLTSPEAMPEGAFAADSDRHDDRDQLVRALRVLTAQQRRVIVLRHMVGLTEHEVAADLGVSVGTVKTTTFRALRRLRVVLSEESGTAARSCEQTSSHVGGPNHAHR